MDGMCQSQLGVSRPWLQQMTSRMPSHTKMKWCVFAREAACKHILHANCPTAMRRRGVSGCCPICRTSHENLMPVAQMFELALIQYLRESYEESFQLSKIYIYMRDLVKDIQRYTGLKHHLPGTAKACLTACALGLQAPVAMLVHRVNVYFYIHI